jgi:hypothetical protein
MRQESDAEQPEFASASRRATDCMVGNDPYRARNHPASRREPHNEQNCPHPGVFPPIPAEHARILLS